MQDEQFELRNHLRGLADEELARMVGVDQAQFPPVALDQARAEIGARGDSYHPIPSDDIEPESGPYRAAWEVYRKRRNLSWIIFLAYLPGEAIIGLPLCQLFHSAVPGFVVFLIWGLAAVITGNILLSWKCPRCGKYFFRKSWYSNSFARKCVHCGLPKWAEA